MKRRWRIILLAAIILLTAGAVAAWVKWRSIYGVNTAFKNEDKILLIPHGAVFDQVMDSLHVLGTLKDEGSFRWVAGKKRYVDRIRPGRYRIAAGMSNNDLVDKLRRGEQDSVRVTFTNIRNVPQLAGKVASYLECDSLGMLDAMTDRAIAERHGFTAQTFIAMFLPNTYEVWWTESPEDFIARMAREHDRFWTDERIARATAIGLTPNEVSTLASIVQAETAKPDEAGRVAGVYLNRLRIGMPLQADPTLKFALGLDSLARIWDQDKQVDSPYNTYTHLGLPPGPINLPEPRFIDAVLNAEKSDYLYFCAREDLSGYHNFAKTYEQHLVNARRYQRALDREGSTGDHVKALLVTMFRYATALTALVPLIAAAQELSSTLAFPEGTQRKVVLWSTRGSEHQRYDSVTTDAKGRFKFEAPYLGTGFYQIALNDSDRADIILARHEKEVRIDFDGLPLQHHVQVVRSDENARLWEYKLVSREAQAVAAAVREERQALAPTEVMRMRELDSIGFTAAERARAQLTRLIQAAPKSYFSRVTSTNRRVEQAMRIGRDSVVKAFDFSDPELLRSSVYANAIGAFLQSAPPRSELDIFRSVDSLLLLSGRDTACYSYTLGYLIELFSAYGPDLALQYTVDKYVVPAGSSVLPRRLRNKVEDLLKVSVGRTGPDVELPDVNGGTRSLSSLAGPMAYTALFFYSSTCDHCHLQMPVLRELYAAYHHKGLEIVGIALDDDTAAFLSTIREERLPWQSFSSFNGWGSPAAKDWQVGATPMLILIDRDLRIIAKPLDAQELALLVKELIP